MAYPPGTRVTVRSVDHLITPGKHRHLLGRTGTITGHENGMNIVTGLTWHDRVTGLHVFADVDLEPTGSGPLPALPPYSIIRAHITPDQ